jgi:CYTH domain-containing protein
VTDRASPSTEIERKFLVRELPPELDRLDPVRIRQGYFVVTEDGSEARVRRAGREHFLTVKSGSGRDRAEIELPIPGRVFDRLWPLTRGRRVRKARYRLPHDGLTIEVDVYRRKLDGLVTAEVEFPDAEGADAFRPPDWFGEEVTADDRYDNRNLARDGLPQGACV